MENIKGLATAAARAMDLPSPVDYDDHGMEVAPGFFLIYNTHTGQSKTVLYHAESDLIFKTVYSPDYDPKKLSERVIGEVTLEGLTFRVRLPYFEYIETNYGYVEVQEYVRGDHCGCDGWCEHGKEMKVATRCYDAHIGNWKITGEEIVLFDFDGIRLDGLV